MTQETIVADYEYPPEWRSYTMQQESFTMNQELVELVKSIRNRADAAILLCHLSDVAKHSLRTDVEPVLHTILEDLYEDAQAVVERYCVKGHD